MESDKDNRNIPRIGKTLGTIANHTKRLKIIKAMAIFLPITLAIAGIILIIISAGGSDNLTSNDTSKYPSTEVVDSSCSLTGGSCNTLIAEIAAKCAGVDKDWTEGKAWEPPTDPRWSFWAKLGKCVDANHTNGEHYNNCYASCTQLVEKVVMATVDQDIWGNGPPPMLVYLAHNCNGKWKEISYGDGDITQYAQPGDIFATCDGANNDILSGKSQEGDGGHDVIYIGNDIARKYFPGTDSNIVQAAYSDGDYGGLPMMDHFTTETLKSRDFHIYRFVGVPDPLPQLREEGIVTKSCRGSGTSRISCQQDNDTSNSKDDNSGTGQEYNAASDVQKRIADACKTTPSPGGGLCAMWVSEVYEAAGLPYPTGNACDMYDQYCTSKDKSELKVGMMIAVRTHNLTPAGSQYGHIGIYIGDGMMMDNIGEIRTISVDEWIATYEGHATSGDGVKWGFGPGVS